MTNNKTFDTIPLTNQDLTVAPVKEETEMLRATDKITALYCRLSQEDTLKFKEGKVQYRQVQKLKRLYIRTGSFLLS